MRKVHNEPCSVPLISIHLDKYYYAEWGPSGPTIPECNQEATLYLQELTSTLMIQIPSQIHPLGNTSHDYQGFPRFLSIYKFPLTTPYQLLCVTDCHVLHRVVLGINTIHPQAVRLLVDNSLRLLEELHSI